MTDLLTAAFLVFLGSQAPCATACAGLDCMMPTYDYQSFPQGPFAWIGNDTQYSLHDKVRREDILIVKDRAELNRLADTTWFGPLCDMNVPSHDALVLDVKAGQWFKIHQEHETKEVTETTKVRTGKLKPHRLVIP